MKPISQQGITASDLARNLSAPKVAKGGVEAGKNSVETEQPAVKSLASAIASQGAPIDTDKVAMIKSAIAEGRYPVDADKIAAQMIALDLGHGDS